MKSLCRTEAFITAPREPICWKYRQLPLILRPKYKYSALGILICSRKEKKLQEKALCIRENPQNTVHFIEQQLDLGVDLGEGM